MTASVPKLLGQVLVVVAIVGVILFISAGRTDWPMAWVFLAAYLACLVITVLVTTRSSPELIVERAEYKPRPGVRN